MSLFSSKPVKQHSHHHHDKSFSNTNLKITLENLIALLNHPKYNEGIDSETMSHTINDVFAYVSGDKDIRIRCPAPMSNLDDRFQYMWPEGAKVTSRPASNTSKASHRSGKPRRLSSRFTGGNIDPELARMAMSVTSSAFSRQHVGFIEEEDEYVTARPPLTQRRRSSVVQPRNTVRVNGGVVKPSPSLERMFASSNIVEDNDDENSIDRQPSHRHNNNLSRDMVPEPINTQKYGKRNRQSRVGFSDE